MVYCERCNKEFKKTSKNQKYCEKCKNISLICDNCNKLYIIPYRLYFYDNTKRNFKTKFCSSKCRNIYFTNDPKEKICKRCNKKFETTKRTNYCSIYCQTHKKCLICKKIIKIDGVHGQSRKYCNACKKEIMRIRKSKLLKTKEYLFKATQWNRSRTQLLKKLKHGFKYNEWKKKVNNTKGVCPECNKFIGINKLTIDHIIPISKAEKGYTYTIDDVQPLCRSCNSSKGNKIY